MSNTLIDHFEYGTWKMQKNSKETIDRVGFRYGHLALLRNDFVCESCDRLHELWSVANLVSATYPFPNAVFQNVDDGIAYIWEISPLAKWDTISLKETQALIHPLVELCIKHNGIPMKVMSILAGIPMENGQLPGTIAGLNGYTKQ